MLLSNRRPRLVCCFLILRGLLLHSYGSSRTVALARGKKGHCLVLAAECEWSRPRRYLLPLKGVFFECKRGWRLGAAGGNFCYAL
jgi:hypothetical protein